MKNLLIVAISLISFSSIASVSLSGSSIDYISNSKIKITASVAASGQYREFSPMKSLRLKISSRKKVKALHKEICQSELGENAVIRSLSINTRDVKSATLGHRTYDGSHVTRTEVYLYQDSSSTCILK